MSKYTVQLRYIVEQSLDDSGLKHDESNWDKAYKAIGLDDYPIFDEAHRAILNNKIIRAHYFREIGFETAGQFKWQMRRFMHEIMPYYNQLYESQNLVTDPLASKDLNYSETWTRDEKSDRNGAASSETESTSGNKNVFQDTPMNGLDTGAIEGMDYATTVTFDDTDAASKTASKNSSEYLGDFEGTKEHRQKGRDKSESELLMLYRDTFINIDLEIVGQCDKLFLHVW